MMDQDEENDYNSGFRGEKHILALCLKLVLVGILVFLIYASVIHDFGQQRSLKNSNSNSSDIIASNWTNQFVKKMFITAKLIATYNSPNATEEMGVATVHVQPKRNSTQKRIFIFNEIVQQYPGTKQSLWNMSSVNEVHYVVANEINTL